MPSQERYLGIDMGTSGVKAVLFDSFGHVTASGHSHCVLNTGPAGRAELYPDAILNAVVEAVKLCTSSSSCVPSKIEAVGFSCHHHSLMAVDGKGEPLTNILTWADNRAAKEAEVLGRSSNVAHWYHRTGCRNAHPMYPLSKIIWFRENEAATFAEADRFVTAKEYVLFKLFGIWAVDDTLASAQGYYDIHRHSWDRELLEDVAGITAKRLSEIVGCTHILRRLLGDWPDRLGLLRDTPFVVGSGDGITANLGCGVLNRSAFSSTVGTSGAIRTTVDEPLTDVNGGTWCYAFLKNKWVAGGAINNGAVALTWLRREFGFQFEKDMLGDEKLMDTMNRLAASIAPASDGLIFLPYMLGERCPDWNASARGLVYGLDFTHTRAHFVRAIMEGVMFRLFTVDRALSALCGSGGLLRASGGYTNSAVWLQMQADIFGRRVEVSEVTEASALGAAFLAMYAVGAISNLEEGLPAMKPSLILEPDPGSVVVYEKWKEVAERTYDTNYPNVPMQAN